MKNRRIFLFGSIFLGFIFFLSVIITLFQKQIPIGSKVALVRVEGPIFESKTAVNELKGYLKDKSIKAIVLRVDSPGGGVVAAQEIYAEVLRASAEKKIVVSMGALAASGGYYISAPATKIIANPGTITGSIGVIMEVPNIKGLMDKIGIKSEVIKSGRNKDLASVFRGIGTEERAILQGVMDDVHEQFIKAVADGRKMPVSKVKDFADGRVFSGKQALKLGLVDELGDLEAAIKSAALLAGIQGEPEVVSKKEKTVLHDLLNGSIMEILWKRMPATELKYLYRF
ncbi:MAG: signal peptide peptidase SppA [Nitrospirae bacterium]|nr:MAG: signal peptide peptidase SppA [Nitrospirota bacterium]